MLLELLLKSFCRCFGIFIITILHYIIIHFHNYFQAPTKPQEPSNSLEFKKQPLPQTVISKFPNPCSRCCHQHSVCRPKRGRHLSFHFAKKQKNYLSSVHASGKKALLTGTQQSHTPLRLVELPFSQHLFSKLKNFLFRFTLQLPAQALWGCG
jgi:hypothetical protein